MTVREHVPLAPLTTLKIGGPARYFIEVHTEAELEDAIAYARERVLPIFVLGGGSNILVADEGFPGVVIALRFLRIESLPHEGGVRVTVGAGVAWDAFVAQMVTDGNAGLEALSGIPGTVGGAVVANAGAYGTECADCFVSARVLDLNNLAQGVQTVVRDACAFSYHDSLFSQQPGRYVILDAKFQLATGGLPDFSYRDNRFNFTDVMAAEQLPHTFAGLRSAVLTIRERKGVLEHCYQSAGSFFHMPKVSAAVYAHIREVAEKLDAAKEEEKRPWAWLQTDGSYKVAPGFLLEYTPFQKGYVRGAVGISPKHTLSIINLGAATASEVATLARDMHDAVRDLFGLALEREVQYVGNVEKKVL